MFSFDSNLTAYLFVQLKQMQHRMQEQLKAHQKEQLLRLQHEPQRLLGKPQNTAGMWFMVHVSFICTQRALI